MTIKQFAAQKASQAPSDKKEQMQACIESALNEVAALTTPPSKFVDASWYWEKMQKSHRDLWVRQVIAHGLA